MLTAGAAGAPPLGRLRLRLGLALGGGDEERRRNRQNRLFLTAWEQDSPGVSADFKRRHCPQRHILPDLHTTRTGSRNDRIH